MRRQLFRLGALGLVISAGACATSNAAGPCIPQMNDLQTIGSHNSYKLAIPPAELALIQLQAPQQAAALDYWHLPIPEQLDRGMRQLELDVFYDPEGGRYADPLAPKLSGLSFDATDMYAPGFKVLHVQDVDARSSCNHLIKCLVDIRDWSAAHPDHAPILILVNAKQAPIQLPGSVDPLPFDGAAFDALDAEIRTIFDTNQMITPDQVRGDAATLREAVVTNGWPDLEAARGKVLFALDESPAVVDVYRRGEASLDGHAMFINSPSAEAPDAAYFTLNNPKEQGDLIRRRVTEGFLVRTRADADTKEARAGDYSRLEAALESGAQYISTDYYQARSEWSGYVAKLPGDMVERSNPVRTCAIQ
ncbi:MAG: phosphatidylinositol-specific phospholipase C1-like protein [Henriciella sp.]